MMRFLIEFWQEPARRMALGDSGATAIEYALIAALISLVIIAAMIALGNPVEGLFGGVAGKFTDLEINQG